MIDILINVLFLSLYTKNRFPQLYCQPGLQTAAAQLAAAGYPTTSVTAPSPSSFLLQQAQPSAAQAAYSTNPSPQALLDFAAFEQQQQQQQQQQSQQQQQQPPQTAAYIPLNGSVAAAAAALQANAFNLMNQSAAVSPQAVAAAPNFFTIPHHVVNVNSFQSH